MKKPKLEKVDPIRIRTGAFSVVMKHRRSDGSGGCTGTCFADARVHVHVPAFAAVGTRYELPEQLERLAKILRSTDDDLNGSAEIIILRRIGVSQE